MPIPSLLQRKYEEGFREGVQERVRWVAAFLRQRFGPDARIPAIAQCLATIDTEAWVARISEATDLDELVPLALDRLRPTCWSGRIQLAPTRPQDRIGPAGPDG